MDEPLPDRPTTFPTWLKWSLIGALVVLVVGYGAIFLYAKVLNDSPDEFGSSDLETALGGSAAGSAAPADGGGTWTVAPDSQVGYRVAEVLFGVDAEAVGRTDQVDGELVIEDDQVVSADFTVDVASIESDDGRRDRQFRDRIMSTDEYPEATFSLTEPIDLGGPPAEGLEVSTTATGELTLRGVTNTVTFDLTAQLENGRIGVLGSIPVVFNDYSIANPSFGGITTEDDGLLEFVLVFEPA